MRDLAWLFMGRPRGYLLLVVASAVILPTYIEQVTSLPADPANEWPTFPRRNIAALARDGYLKNPSATNFKRSVSTLAKNGMLPTYRSPYLDTDKQEPEDEQSQEKRNIASIARLRSYTAMKRNIQALARDGFRFGRGQYTQQNEKRNIAALARGGFIHKREDTSGDEYYLPFYQNPLPPLSEVDGPYDENEMYDFQQSINPDMFSPMSQVFKRNAFLAPYSDRMAQRDLEDNWSSKRGIMGMPVHGLYRPMFIDPTVRTKRYILSLPDVLETNDIGDKTDNENEDKRSVDDDEVRENVEKRHIGSLARLGLLPSFRFSGGRYSRSGRARLILPSQELYRKHSDDENFGIREYFTGAEAESSGNTDDTDVSPPAVSPHSHPTARILHRPLSNDLPTFNPSLPSSPLAPPSYSDPYIKNPWQPTTKESPKYYYFRSLKGPYHTSGKRYLLLPAVDNILLRKTYRNSSLPSRRKNQ